MSVLWLTAEHVPVADLYSGASRFESRPGYRLSRLRFFVILLSVHNAVGHDSLLPNAYPFTIHKGVSKISRTESITK
jgi:hypothetical protein